MARKATNNGVKSDYIEHGSDRHAQLLNLRKSSKDDDPELIFGGWTFMDFTMYGAQANQNFLKAILRQRVGELNSKPPIPQSDDRSKDNYAPPMFDPDSYRKQAVSTSEVEEAIETLRRAGLV